MRKRIAGLDSVQRAGESEHGWLDLDQIATVEVTSEDPLVGPNGTAQIMRNLAG